jgi:putative endonuclease
MTKQYYVYFLASKKNGTIYIGVTNNLVKRVFEHKSKFNLGFTNKYEVNKLVYFEVFEESLVAIKREKQLKNWKRDWKINLIERVNIEWKDLYNIISK